VVVVVVVVEGMGVLEEDICLSSWHLFWLVSFLLSSWLGIPGGGGRG